ncbi:MAG: hypothetical protein DI535_12090 [Citrobacter freundii]|nr:MAG: hypothetical protein DI535_12090 [Citrobacter freundii]
MSTIVSAQQSRQQELITPEVQELVNYKPHWLVRRGSMVLLLILLVMLALTFIISYPDIVPSRARLTALNPPKLVKARQEGKLIRLLVQNEQDVVQGQYLGYLESTALFDDVMKLKKWVEETIIVSQSSIPDMIVNQSLPALANLGELQLPYQQVQNRMQIARQTFGKGYYQLKKNVLVMEMEYNRKLKQNNQQQRAIEEQNRIMLQQEYEAYEKLAREKVIAPLELNQYKAKLLSGMQNLEQLDAAATSTEISGLGKTKEMMDIDKQRLDILQQLRSALFELKSQLTQWCRQYVLEAPESGKVLYISSLNENQLVTATQPLMYVQPPQSSYYIEMMAAQKGLGKVNEGQTVVLRVDGYPSEEFGYLTARVSYISNMPGPRDSFLIRAELINGLKTNYGRSVFFRNDLAADAQIITDQRKLISRFAGQLTSLIRR